MKITAESLMARITRLRRDLAQCPSADGMPEDRSAREILQDAPSALSELEAALKRKYPGTGYKEIHASLRKIETDVDWAIGTTSGKRMADRVQSGRDPDPGETAQRRLNQRFAAFLAGFLQADSFLSLVREWAGDDVIRGSTIHLDPHEVEAMTQWMLHDKILPGQSRRLIDLFAERHLSDLPADEQDWLRRYTKDTPSVYQVSGIAAGEGYRIRDLLSGATLQIRDRLSSLTLAEGDIFIGRVIPAAAKETDAFCPLGSVTELPAPLWSELSSLLQQWMDDDRQQYPDASPAEFFRRHHAMIRRQITP